MIKLIKKTSYYNKLQRFKSGGIIPKFQGSGKLPIGNQKQYDYATEIYQSFVDNGADPQVALDLTNLVIAEGGWFQYKTGDGKQFKNASDLTRYVVEHHQRMFPDSLKATDWNSFYRGLNETSKYKYNSEKPNYKQWIYQSRPEVKKRINHYRSQQGLSPLAYQDYIEPSQEILESNIT